jgi:hypothetical protein
LVGGRREPLGSLGGSAFVLEEIGILYSDSEDVRHRGVEVYVIV